MSSRIKRVVRGASLRCGAGVVALVAAGPAFAQVAEPVRDPAAAETEVQTTREPSGLTDASAPVGSDDTSDEDSSQIVVTGTLLRGVVPTGTNVIGVTQKAIQETGATTTAQLLQTIPQLGSFGQLQFPVGAGNTVTVNRPNLRSLPGFNTAGGSTTLVLLDGHRLVGAGVSSTTADPDAIPPGAIERLEIVPDGGSAVYGSDAVAGVLNFVTRKRFDGVKVDAHYGFADDYYQYDVNATVGKDWGSGSAYISYNYSKHDDIFGRDRDYIRHFPDASSGRLEIRCNPGTVQAGVPFYRLPFTTATAAGAVGTNQCDVTDDSAFYPAEHRHSVFASLYQELSDSLSFDLKGYYTNRKIAIVGGPLRQSSTVTAASPFFASHRVGAETAQGVNFTIGDLVASTQRIGLETYGITPMFTAKLGSNWQLRVIGNVGESETISHAPSVNTTALGNAINAGFFNPYSPYDTTPPNYAAALGAITNFETFGQARQFMTNARAVIDGDLFNLPGGAVKLAAGAEYYHESYKVRLGSAVPGTATAGFAGQSIGGVPIIAPVTGLPLRKLSRNVKSAFGELVVPIFGQDNATTLLQELTFSVSGRYDKYNDVGSTFNPKFGVTWKPIDWIKLRAQYGKSFNAPSLADAPGADLTTVFIIPGGLPAAGLQVPAGGIYPVPTALQTARIAVRGNSPGIGPQTAKTFSAGFDLTPPFIEGLTLSATYYKIKLGNVIGLPPAQNTQLVYRDYPQVVTVNPTAAQVNALIATASPGALLNLGVTCPTGILSDCVYLLADIRKQNLGNFKLSGLDFNFDYNRPTSFGSIQAGFKGTYELTRLQSGSGSLPFVDQLVANNSRFSFRANLGAEVGNLLGQVFLNHRAGYKLNPIVGFIPQSRVSAFNVVDLFFRYDVKGDGVFSDLQFTLNVNNVLDQDPPEFRGSQTPILGITNGNTIGRLIQVGVSKRF